MGTRLQESIKRILKEEDWFQEIEMPVGESLYSFLKPILVKNGFKILKNRWKSNNLRYKIFPIRVGDSAESGINDYIVWIDEEDFNINNIRKQIEHQIKFHKYWKDYNDDDGTGLRRTLHQRRHNEEMLNLSKKLLTLIP